jgi:hypothetical protein
MVGTAWAEPAAHPPIPALPLSFAVASSDGSPVVDPPWLDAQVDRANEVFGRHGVRFELLHRRPLDSRHAMLETRRDRHALGAEAQPGVINCFVVKSLRDVDDPSRFRRGVHWHPKGFPRMHFIILSSIAGPGVLTHELGHFFGNREHSPVRGNVMSYDWGDGEPVFDPAQVARIRDSARRFLRTRELVAVERPR